MSTSAVLRRRWKALELALAKRLGGERVPVTGRTRGYVPDIRHPGLAIEVKSRKAQLVMIAEMMDQAEKAAAYYLRRGEGARLPIGIYHVLGTRLANAYVFMRLADFEKIARDGEVPGWRIGVFPMEDTSDGDDSSGAEGGSAAGSSGERALRGDR